MMGTVSVLPPPDAVTSASGASGPDAVPSLDGLLRACARGDEAAFAQVYDQTSARLFGLIVRILRDPAQSEEVAQEAFLDIWRHSARFDPAAGSALSWMLTIAHRKAVDRVRSAQAAGERDVAYGVRTQETAHDATAEAAEASLEAQRVRRALRGLTETQRGAVELAYLQGYSHTEVANLLGIPLGTAKTRIRDGLIRLRDTLGVQS